VVLIKNRKHFASCLFFDVDFYQHAKDIYDEPQWPKSLLCKLPSVTDKTAAPEGMESDFSCTFSTRDK
jgi:phytoene desaturase